MTEDLSSEDDAYFREMQTKGASPESVFLAAERKLDRFAAIRVIRAVFGLSLEAAKEVMVGARGEAASLAGHQEQLLPSLERALTDKTSGRPK